MAPLKELRIRKKSVQATKKITMAMKMIAAAKLKKAQKNVEAARPYARSMAEMIHVIAGENDQFNEIMPLLTGTGSDQIQLIACITSDRGLCGGFNSAIVRQVRQIVANHFKHDRQVKIICIGQKGYEQLKRYYPDKIIDHRHNQAVSTIDLAKLLAYQLLDQLAQQQFDVCTVVYSKFQTALSSEMTVKQLIPVEGTVDLPAKVVRNTIYEFEPNKHELLKALLPQYLIAQIFAALTETAASEQGARTTAMDSATRNAQDMISDLELLYNRTRQGQITRELIEIISGAEAL